jgi:hypothetical protein
VSQSGPVVHPRFGSITTTFLASVDNLLSHTMRVTPGSPSATTGSTVVLRTVLHA